MNEPIMNDGWYDARVNPPVSGDIIVIFENGNKGFLYWAPNDSLKYRHVRYWRPFPKSPEPDPFEEWWQANFHRCPPGDLIKPHEDFKACWQAAVQWVRKNAAEFDEKLAKLEKERDGYARQGDHGRATAAQSDIDELIRKKQ